MSENFIVRMKTLKEHKGFVKGLSLDPTGLYLASQVSATCFIVHFKEYKDVVLILHVF